MTILGMNPILFRIAVRNLVRRSRKNLVVAALIAVGVAAFFVGNAVLESSIGGIQRTFSDNFTADLSISEHSEQSFSLFGPDIPERLEDLLRRGERDALVEIFLREVVGVSEAELQALRRSSTWRVRVQAAHTLPREVRMAETYRFDPSRLAKVRTPTLLLLGTESPRLMHDSTMAAHAALQNSRVELLPGQGHAAMTTAPEMFLAKVMAFLEDET